jgi:transposase
MRGDDVQQDAMFSYLSPEARVPRDHPLRPIRDMVNKALAELSGEFQAMYSREGRPSIPPEKLLRALLLQILYTIRSARLLMEQLDYNLLFRWFVGLSMDDKVWDHSVFFQESGALSRFGPGHGLFRPHTGAGENRQTAVGRAFHRGRHSD